jgi:hypothetical protein
MTATFTTGTAAMDAFVSAVRMALPGVQVIRAYQRQADAPAPAEPYASIAIVPLGPQGHPVIGYPDEAGTQDATVAPYDIRQTIDQEHRAVVGVGLFGDDALELCEFLDATICGEVPQMILYKAGVSFFPSPTDLEDVTRLQGDRWQYALIRTYRIGWQRRDHLRAQAIETITVTPVVTEET